MPRTSTNDPAVVKLCRAAFPDYRGRKFRVTTFDPAQPFEFHSDYWSGGSRSYWSVIDTRTGRPAQLPTQNPLTTRTPETIIPPGFVVVERSIFMGREVGCTLYQRGAEQLPAAPAVPALPEAR